MDETATFTIGLADRDQFRRTIADASTEQLAAVAQGPQRTEVLDTCFAVIAGAFRPDRAGHIAAVVHWNIGDRPGGGFDTYQLVIGGGGCALSESPDQKPELALNVDAVEFLKLMSGKADPVALYMTGKLQATGDMGLAMKVAQLFDMART